MDEQIDITLRIYRLIKEIFLWDDNLDRKVLTRSGITTARFNLLGQLVEHGSLSPSRLGQLLLCDSANVTRLLDGLENDQLIESLRHDTSGRRIFVSLTPAGRLLW